MPVNTLNRMLNTLKTLDPEVDYTLDLVEFINSIPADFLAKNRLESRKHVALLKGNQEEILRINKIISWM